MVGRFEEMLKGKLEDLPPKTPSEIRIFLSSTFAGMLLYVFANNTVLFSSKINYNNA